MGTNWSPLVADLFLLCYERDFMTSLSDVKQAEIIVAFKSTSIYLDDLLNIDNPYFEGMVNRSYPPELRLNKANTVTHKSTVTRTVMCRQDGRGRFPVLLDDHSKCRTNSQRKSQLS